MDRECVWWFFLISFSSWAEKCCDAELTAKLFDLSCARGSSFYGLWTYGVRLEIFRVRWKWRSTPITGRSWRTDWMGHLISTAIKQREIKIESFPMCNLSLRPGGQADLLNELILMVYCRRSSRISLVGIFMFDLWNFPCRLQIAAIAPESLISYKLQSEPLCSCWSSSSNGFVSASNCPIFCNSFVGGYKIAINGFIVCSLRKTQLATTSQVIPHLA